MSAEEKLSITDTEVPDNLTAYMVRVAPLVEEIVRICRELRLPTLMAFQTASDGASTSLHFPAMTAIGSEMIAAARPFYDKELNEMLISIARDGSGKS